MSFSVGCNLGFSRTPLLRGWKLCRLAHNCVEGNPEILEFPSSCSGYSFWPSSILVEDLFKSGQIPAFLTPLLGSRSSYFSKLPALFTGLISYQLPYFFKLLFDDIQLNIFEDSVLNLQSLNQDSDKKFEISDENTYTMSNKEKIAAVMKFYKTGDMGAESLELCLNHYWGYWSFLRLGVLHLQKRTYFFIFPK